MGRKTKAELKEEERREKNAECGRRRRAAITAEKIKGEPQVGLQFQVHAAGVI